LAFHPKQPEKEKKIDHEGGFQGALLVVTEHHKRRKIQGGSGRWNDQKCPVHYSHPIIALTGFFQGVSQGICKNSFVNG